MINSIGPLARDGKDWRVSTPQWLQGIANLPADYRSMKPSPYHRPLVRCWVGDLDVGRAMVRQDWAIAEVGLDYEGSRSSSVG
jgi:hypothetical protein